MPWRRPYPQPKAPSKIVVSADEALYPPIINLLSAQNDYYLRQHYDPVEESARGSAKYQFA